MSSNSDTTAPPSPLVMENNEDGSTSIDEDMTDVEYNQQSRSQVISSGASSTSSTSTITTTRTHNGPKRHKEISPCYVCGAKAHGYNFDQITCESCKAFFRRSALKPMEKFRCRNNNSCTVTAATRKRCKRCRLAKCFQVGMRKEWILTEEEKVLKREKIERNRLIKQQAKIVLQQQPNDLTQSDLQSTMKTLQISPTSSSHFEQSRINPFQLTYIYHPADQQMYQRQQYLLEQISNGYQLITKQYPQPNKFFDRNMTISQTNEIESKLNLIKDLTRELTQMTTLRLLNFFNLIPEFQSLTQLEKQSLLVQNMLAVFMFHGALTYNPKDDTFVDRATADQPYDAKYLLYVYGPKVYDNFVALAREFTSVTYQSVNDIQSYEHAHTLFLLLMVVLLFSNNLQLNPTDTNQSKFYRIQQNYIDITCRFIHDQFGMTVGRRMFKRLVPLLIGLQKLCSTLANVNLCEMAQDEDRSSQTIHSTQPAITSSASSSTRSSPTEFNSTMISERSHLNEVQKENREPSSIPLNNNRSALSVLSNSSSSSPPPPATTTTSMTFHNC